MATRRIKFTPHSEEVIAKIIQLCDDGIRSKDIYKMSKQLFGYTVKQSTISEILTRNGRTPKANTFRIRKAWKKYKILKIEEKEKTGLKIYKPDEKPTEIFEDYVEPEMIEEV